MQSITELLSQELGQKLEYVENVVRLMDEGNTIPFIARYRKEQHGSMDDTTLRNLETRLNYLRGLQDRREEVRRAIENQGKLTQELSSAIDAAATLAEVEDLYLPYKQKRRTRASIAKERGLEPLADAIFQQDGRNPEELAKDYVDPEKEVNTVEDALQAWDHLMLLGYGAQDIILAGDSAGGNLALVLCLRLRGAGRRLPGGLVLFSPWTDMTMSGPSYGERAAIDPMLTANYIDAVRRAYAPGEDFSHPELSPLFGDLSGFPRTLVQVGDHEILFSDAQRLAEALRRQNVPARLEVSEGMWHVFQMFPSKKAAAALQSVARFLLEE